jgi:hypothetical protein
MSETTQAVTSSANGGIGLVGMLLILGLFGIGPCTNCMKGCGPVVDVPAVVHHYVGE